ncbi:MAG: prepilin-type N-terminal cleavage/methylation domain-containing protein [Candidatus Marinimicrobia bacterium]|nr:prepilin-type N-terminal cleavage/methylation domain-containing protein [Candidatus Neomarinimicrobiota bacterium]
MKNIPSIKSEGFTLVELIATMVIFTTVLTGMIYVFAETNIHFTREFKRSEVMAYGNRVLDDMAYSLKVSKGVTYGTYGNFQKVIIDLGGNNRVTYTINREEGLLKNGRSLGYFRTKHPNGNTLVEIAGFSCGSPTEWSFFTDPKVRSATYNVRFTLNLLDETNENTILEKLYFEREVFSPTLYKKVRLSS